MKYFLLIGFTFFFNLLNAQNVGIGTTGPLMKLHVSGNSNNLVVIENTNNISDNVGPAVYFKTGSNYSGAIKSLGAGGLSRLGLFNYLSNTPDGLIERLSILDNGFTGINNITPTSMLHITGVTARTLAIENTAPVNPGVTTSVGFMMNGTYTHSIRSIGNGPSDARLGFFVGITNFNSQAELVTLTTSGLGIGIISPEARFHVKAGTLFGSPHMVIEDESSNPVIVKMKNNVSNAEWRTEAYNTAANSSSNYTIKYILNGVQTRVMQMNGNGRIGIGTSVIDAPLHIYSNSSTTVPQLLVEESQTEYARIKMRNSTGSYWDIAAQGAATNADGYFNLYFFNGTTGANKFVLNGNGNLTIAGTLTQNSDERLKKDIVSIDHSLQKIERIGGYYYNWKDADRDPALQTGVLAQEIEKVMPELVTQNEQGIKSVNYIGIVPYLIEAIKSLQHEVAELKQKQ